MSAPENRQHAFPAVPHSLSAGDYEMRDYYAAQNAPRPPPNQSPYLTPYLGLRARLSQIWINRWTVLLLLVLVRTLLAVSSLDHGLASARKEALSACTSVETAGSALASMPHYMSTGVNELTANSVEKAVNGLMSMVGLTVTGVEEIVVFIIGLLTNTYLCLITLAVSGSLHAGIELVQNVEGFLNNTLGSIGDDFSKAGTGLQNLVNDVFKGINGIPFVNGQIPQIDLSKEISELKDLQLPGDLNDELQKLNASIPTFADVKNFTETVIRFPFEELKKLINETMGTYEFNRTLLPVPQKEQLNFCSDNDGINDFFDDLVDIAHIARKIFLGTLLTAAILVCIPLAWWEIKRWRRLQERANNIGKEAVDPMDAVYMASRPYTSQGGMWLGSKAHSYRHRTLLRWFVAYTTSVPALFILSLALAGLFACLCQYILLRSIEKEVPSLTAQVGAFAEKVVVSVNNASMAWANGTNTLIVNENTKINDDLFGWVNSSTTALNDTLNAFVDKTTEVINATFGDTLLREPIQGVFDCLIGLKIQGIESALTWVHDNAHVNFPLLDNQTFTLKNLASHTDSSSDDNFLASPNSETQDNISEAVNSLIDAIKRGIRQEAIISTVILMLWFVVILMGLARVGVLLFGHDKMRGEGGQDYPSNHNDHAFAAHDNAPPPQYNNPDVTGNGYTLNPHPFPRSASPSPVEEALFTGTGEKRSHVGVRDLLNQITHPRQAHKSMHGAIINEKTV